VKNWVVAAALVVIIALGAGAGYLSGTENGHTTTNGGTTTNGNTNTNGGTTTLQDYGVEFVQESNCQYESLVVPWGVVINESTVTQPSNATLPLSYAATSLSGNSSYSTIRFSLPDGTYTYSVIPSGFDGQEQTGNVTVDGSGLVVPVTEFITAMGCSSSSSQQTVTTTVTTTVAGSCPSATTEEYPSSGFIAEVSYQGPWNATISTYSAFATTPAYLLSTCHYGGNGTAYVYVAPPNPNGEQTVLVSGQKLDSGGGNLTVTVSYGVASRSNSTASPFGTATTFYSTAP
jgi:hypothetical protein